MPIAPDNPFPQPEPGHRDWYAFEAIRSLPRLILMCDKNALSKTYGSFDRSFWHYRTMDFPCGMNQEFVLPLAIAYNLDYEHNPYKGMERLRELAEAGIDYARKSGHKNGTTDDYFPFERALGALVFSLYAMTESAIELGLNASRHLEFFARRGKYLANHNETGQLANHQAFAALALYNVYVLTGDEQFRDASNQFRNLTLSWQHEEGWFQEYEGADPGYHSCLIAFLVKLWQKSGDDSLIEPLGRAVDFAHDFMHPDGSYAGEYGSRNTFHFYPHGFEVLSRYFPKAGEITETFLQRAMPERTRYYNDDDRMAAHYVYDWMQAWRDYNPDRQSVVALPEETEVRWYSGAKLFVIKTPEYHAVAAANKGGTFKAVAEDRPFAGDTGIMGKLDDGRVIVSHVVDKNRIRVDREERTLEVTGRFQRRRAPLPTPTKQIVFRVLLLTIGRFNPNLVRSLLQKILITGKAPLEIYFRRRFKFDDYSISIVDEVDASHDKKARFERLVAGTDATSIYVANSNTFQRSVLLPWTWFDDRVSELNKKRKIKLKRTVSPRRKAHIEQ